MTVIGTPVIPEEVGVDDCSTQNTITPITTRLYGIALPEKRRSVLINQGTTSSFQIQLLDTSGRPIDLTTCAIGVDSEAQGDIIAKLREVITTRSIDTYTVTGIAIDPAIGLVEFDSPMDVSNNPGVYNFETGIYNGDGNLVFTNQLYLWVNRGLFGDPRYPHLGPPNLDEIRLYIRDNSPGENLLLEDFEFDLADICHATELGVRYWNESQPPLDYRFRTVNYPLRDMWLTFIAGHLLLTEAHRFRRNHLPYSAGGISVDDQNKYNQYDQMGAMLIKDYRDYVRKKKIQINCEGAMQSRGSAYGSLSYNISNYGL